MSFFESQPDHGNRNRNWKGIPDQQLPVLFIGQPNAKSSATLLWMPQQAGSQWDDINDEGGGGRRRNEMKNEDNGYRTSHSSTVFTHDRPTSILLRYILLHRGCSYFFYYVRRERERRMPGRYFIFFHLIIFILLRGQYQFSSVNGRCPSLSAAPLTPDHPHPTREPSGAWFNESTQRMTMWIG